MAVTIKDVAAAAGVSPSTVSRTCKDSPSISRETKERVRRIMAQLGYEPNFEAEPVEAFSKTIGIILPSSQRDVYENAFHLEIIRGIGQFCNQRRYVNTVITGPITSMKWATAALPILVSATPCCFRQSAGAATRCPC